MADLRHKEAIFALKAVGAIGGFSLQKRSSQLEGEMGEKTQRDLLEIFQGISPQEVFLPAPYERHRTHQRCTRLIIEALRAAVGIERTLLGSSF